MATQAPGNGGSAAVAARHRAAMEMMRQARANAFAPVARHHHPVYDRLHAQRAHTGNAILNHNAARMGDPSALQSVFGHPHVGGGAGNLASGGQPNVGGVPGHLGDGQRFQGNLGGGGSPSDVAATLGAEMATGQAHPLMPIHGFGPGGAVTGPPPPPPRPVDVPMHQRFANNLGDMFSPRVSNNLGNGGIHNGLIPLGPGIFLHPETGEIHGLGFGGFQLPGGFQPHPGPFLPNNLAR